MPKSSEEFFQSVIDLFTKLLNNPLNVHLSHKNMECLHKQNKFLQTWRSKALQWGDLLSKMWPKCELVLVGGDFKTNR